MHDIWKSCFFFSFSFFFFWKWMRHGWMPLVCKLMHDFWKPWYLRKRWFLFLFFKMNESWSNAPSLEIDAWFLEIFIFSLKRWWWWSLFLKKWMRHGWMPLVCKLMHDLWKPWYLRKKWFLLFSKWMRHGRMPLV